jgi:quinohemoprotein ethanol dehydrogenase
MGRARKGFFIAVTAFAVLSLSVAAAGNSKTLASSGTQAAGHVAISAPPAFTGKQLAAQAGNNWIDFGGNSFGDRYSTLRDITTDNASKLQVAWHIHLGEPKGQNVAGGLAYNGTFYIPSVQGDVFALDGSTGQQLWKYTAASPGGGRGLAMGQGMIFYSEKDCRAIALNATTGALVWRTDALCDPTQAYSFSGPLTYAALNHGEVLVGTAGSDSGIRGSLMALNAKTGKLLWQHYLIPGKKGDPGYSSWGKPADLAHGGAGVWTQPEVDPKTGLIIVATANAAPYANRPAGNDLFTASDVALNAKTGKMVWYYQFVHHDEWDYDVPQNPTLFDFRLHGKLVHALDQPLKMGENFILNRVNGKPLIPAPEIRQPQSPQSPNTSKTQPIPQGDMFAQRCATPEEWLQSGGKSLIGPDGNPIIFGCIFTPVVSTNYTLSGWHDVADWLPSTFSASTGLMNICATENRGKGYEAIPLADAKPIPGTGSYTEVNGLSAGDNAFGHKGEIFAYDPHTNLIAWNSVLPGGNACYAGLASTAGRVLFAGTGEGKFLAYNAANGNLLWSSGQLDGSIGSSPIVYKGSDGREYVTLIVGGTSEGGNIAVQNDSVYAFALPK